MRRRRGLVVECGRLPEETEKIRVLEADPDLAHGLDPEALAQRDALAAVHTVAAGNWEAVSQFGEKRGWLGLLLVSGFVTREMVLAGDATVELLDPGDLLRPWDHDGEYTMPDVHISFTALEKLTLAVLDADFAVRIGPWPALVAAIVGRPGERARWLALRIAIVHLDRIEGRLLILFGHLAERWGRDTEGARSWRHRSRTRSLRCWWARRQGDRERGREPSMR